MKKKIIFMVINMNVGGTEKALLNMISALPKEKFDITILMLEKKGGFLDFIPGEVHVELLEEYESIKDIINEQPQMVSLNYIRNGKFIKAINIILFHILSKITKDRSIFFRYVLYKYPVNKNEYDIAVAYAGPMDFISYFIINKIKAKKKVQWIHFDITKIGFSKKFAEKIYNRFDKIFVVSEEGRDKVIRTLPHLNDKTASFFNLISPSSIIKMSNEEAGFEDNYNGVRILTVGRLTKEKGQDLTIPVLAKLKEDGYNVRWYCIGDGGAKKEYEELAKEHGVDKGFIFLGTKANPYPFMKQCDIYVQPSRHEGYCITLAEAKCFNKPIITTDFTGAADQIINGQTGLIVKFNENEMYKAVKRLLDDKELKSKLEMNLSNKKLNGTNEMKKFFDLVPH